MLGSGLEVAMAENKKDGPKCSTQAENITGMSRRQAIETVVTWATFGSGALLVDLGNVTLDPAAQEEYRRRLAEGEFLMSSS